MTTNRNRAQADSVDHIQEDFIEIHDPEIDPQHIISEIRARIQARRAELGYELQNFPSYGGVNYPEKPDDIPYDPNLYRYLKAANKIYTEVETEAAILPSPATRIPLLGRLWGMIRHQAHGLVLFYVNRFVQHEVNVNRHLVSVLNLLTITTQEQQRQILELEDEIEALRAQLEE